jgi:hypothetical protein
MNKPGYHKAPIIFVLGFLLMTGIAAAANESSAAAANDITAEQFKEMILLLSHLDHGKTVLVAVQGDKVIEVTEFALLKKISLSGIKTTFYLQNTKTGVKTLVVAYEAGETSKSAGRMFWGMICRSTGSCGGCTQLFGENPCK